MAVFQQIKQYPDIFVQKMSSHDRRVQVQLTETIFDNVFVVVAFLVLNLFYRRGMQWFYF